MLSVNKGQTEAADALRLHQYKTLRLATLTRAMRVIILQLICHYLSITKNSPLAFAVGYMDVPATLGGIKINQTGTELGGILLLGLFYLAFFLIISSFMNIYTRRKEQ